MSAKLNVTPIRHPLLVRIHEMRLQVNAQLDALIEEFHRLADDNQRMISTARGFADDLSNAEAAQMLSVSVSAMQQGTAGTDCLYRARIKNGRQVRHAKWRLELHRINVEGQGHCGDCDKAQKPNLLQIR